MGTIGKFSKNLMKHNIWTIFYMDRKVNNLFKTPQQMISNETTGIYEVLCADCNITYIGQSNSRIHEHKKEHIMPVKKRYNTSELSKYFTTTGHTILCL